MGVPVPPFPQKPDWMSEDEFREQVIRPYMVDLAMMGARQRSSVGPFLVAAVIALLVLIPMGIVALWR